MISEQDKQRIIRAAFGGKTSPFALGGPPSVVVLGGLPAAGKTTVLAEHEDENFVYASPDWVKVEAGNYSPEFHRYAAEINLLIINEARKCGFNLLYDSLLDNYGRAAGTIRKYLAKQGVAQVVYANVSYETSLARCIAREVVWELEGQVARHVPAGVIVRSYNHSLPTLVALYKKYESDQRVRFLIYDNDQDFEEARLIAEKTGGTLRLSDEILFDELMCTDYVMRSRGHYERTKSLGEQDFDECRARAGARSVDLVIEKGRDRGWQEMERQIREHVFQKHSRREDPLDQDEPPE